MNKVCYLTDYIFAGSRNTESVFVQVVIVNACLHVV